MKRIFSFLKENQIENYFFLMFLLLNGLVGYLFDIEKDVILVLLLIYGLVSVFYLFVKFSRYSDDLDLKEAIKTLKKELKEEEEKNIAFRNELKDYFLTWIHQVKTPITSLNLYAESLEEHDRQMLKMLSMSIDNYTQMALSYLKLIDFSSDMNINKYQLSEMIKKVIKKYRIHFIASNTKLIFEDFDYTVISDKNYLEIMIEQILNNALKYAAGSNVFIGFRDGYLYIKDTGPGIAKDEIKKIFNRGYSVSNAINPHQSSGIGLYIVKRISDKLNHPVVVQSEMGEFTEFRIYFSTNLQSCKV